MTIEDISKLLDEKLDDKLGALKRSISRIEIKLDAVELKVDSMNNRIYSLEARQASMDAKLDRILNGEINIRFQHESQA